MYLMKPKTMGGVAQDFYNDNKLIIGLAAAALMDYFIFKTVLRPNPGKYAVIVGNRAWTAYTMEEALITAKRKHPGKQVDIYSMKTGKLVRTVRKGKK